jgi:hypothetical protein
MSGDRRSRGMLHGDGAYGSTIVYGLERFLEQDAGRAIGPLRQMEVETGEGPAAGPGDGSEKE